MLQVAAVVASVGVSKEARANFDGWEKRASFWLRRWANLGTVLYYPGGKLIIRGARSVENAKKGLALAARSLGVRPEGDPWVHNIVFQAELPRRLNLEALMLVLDNVTYEPEIFPGLVYKTGQGSETVLVFSSGKAVLTGLKTQEEAEKVWSDFVRAIVYSGQD